MLPRLPISVFIIAKNEADRIDKPILSTRDWVDEVIVIDSGSTDGTVAVADALGAKTYYHEWRGYGPQKVYGESLCRNQWLLNLDADEEISPQLAEEIKALFAHGEPISKGYILKIKALYRFEEKLSPFGSGTTQIRLYHKGFAGFKDSTVHDSVVMRDTAITPVLKAPVVHRCFRSHGHAVEKINFYTAMQAEDLWLRGKRPSAVKIICTPFIAFLKCYFLKRHFVHGVDGFIRSVIYAFNRLLRLAKAREIWQEKDSQQRSQKGPEAY